MRDHAARTDIFLSLPDGLKLPFLFFDLEVQGP